MSNPAGRQPSLYSMSLKQCIHPVAILSSGAPNPRLCPGSVQVVDRQRHHRCPFREHGTQYPSRAGVHQPRSQPVPQFPTDRALHVPAPRRSLRCDQHAALRQSQRQLLHIQQQELWHDHRYSGRKFRHQPQRSACLLVCGKVDLLTRVVPAPTPSLRHNQRLFGNCHRAAGQASASCIIVGCRKYGVRTMSGAVPCVPSVNVHVVCVLKGVGSLVRSSTGRTL